MKKVIRALCAAAMLSLVFACGDKDNKEDASRYDEGVYSPSKRIVSVTEGDNVTDWIWEDDLLARLVNATGGDTVIEFAYNGNQVCKIKPVHGGFNIEEVTLKYNGRRISEIILYAHGRQVARATLTHNSEALIHHLDIEVDDEYFTELVDLIDAYLGGDTNLRKAMPPKFTVGSSIVTIDIDWAGTNASQLRIFAHFTGTANGTEIARGVNIIGRYMDIPSSYAAILTYLAADEQMPFTLTVKDTIDLTYDNKKNPLCGFLGKIDVALLSTNNIVSQTGRTTVEASLKVNVPVLGQQTYNLPHSFEPRTTTYSYTYTPDNYPLQVTKTKGEEVSTKTYNYAN